MVNLIVVTHGEFGAYLVEAAEEIVGAQPDGIRAVSISPRLSLGELRLRLEKTLAELDAGDGLVVVTDMPGGTPANLVLPLVKDRPRVRAVSGLNLYMLVAAFSRRREADLDGLVQAMLAAGQKSIQDIKAKLETQYSKAG